MKFGCRSYPRNQIERTHLGPTPWSGLNRSGAKFVPAKAGTQALWRCGNNWHRARCGDYGFARRRRIRQHRHIRACPQDRCRASDRSRRVTGAFDCRRLFDACRHQQRISRGAIA